MGGIDIICFDKTGTITKNNITVSNLYADNFAYENDINISSNNPLFRIMAENIMVNNTAKL